MRLTTTDHDRDAAGFTYVYPVVSRRAQGVSVGINLNPNNACNWRCVYCQVPGLMRGKPPATDLARLRVELWALLEDVVRGDFMTRVVPEGSRRLNDIAFSGNGEPTTSPQFGAAVDLVGEALDAFGLRGAIKVVLITNGSMLAQGAVAEAIERLATHGGEVWFKLDAATRAGLEAVNSTPMHPADHLDRLRRCAALCPTWIQTCVFARDGQAPSAAEQEAYLEAIEALAAAEVPPEGVHLYGLARQSHQPEAPTLSALPAEWLEEYAERIRGRGLAVRVSV
jgi:wyosine [tRNA(Phe)-imidazoG37] synthetase (radical SAM superfamily)